MTGVHGSECLGGCMAHSMSAAAAVAVAITRAGLNVVVRRTYGAARRHVKR